MRDVCHAHGNKMALALFGPAGLNGGEATDISMEVMKSFLRWAWARQRRAGLVRLKRKDEHQKKYEKAREALENLQEDSTPAYRMKIAKAAFEAVVNFSKDLRLVSHISLEAQEQVDEVAKLAKDLIEAMRNTDAGKSLALSDLVGESLTHSSLTRSHSLSPTWSANLAPHSLRPWSAGHSATRHHHVLSLALRPGRTCPAPSESDW